jgi:NAD(P)H-flavin reductase
MNPIKQITGTITHIRELSPTAREYTIRPSEPFPFTAGAFVNIFIDHEGESIRRAFSISSTDQDTGSFTLSIRLSPNGKLTPLLWSTDYTNATIKLMGPLGLNTADKLSSRNSFLFGFGIGAGVVKSLADHIVQRGDLESLTIVTGSRTIDEILHKEYFDKLCAEYTTVHSTYVVSDQTQSAYPVGYIQDHVAHYTFDNADIYMCGQGVACTALEATIKATNPQNCHFFIEDFH